jgi:hypothetical protein
VERQAIVWGRLQVDGLLVHGADPLPGDAQACFRQTPPS